MTTTGRRLARSWTGVQAYKAPPAGTLKEWHWRALARAYAAGDEGSRASMASMRTSASGPGSVYSSTKRAP
jgi:hypothetical protein